MPSGNSVAAPAIRGLLCEVEPRDPAVMLVVLAEFHGRCRGLTPGGRPDGVSLLVAQGLGRVEPRRLQRRQQAEQAALPLRAAEDVNIPLRPTSANRFRLT
jgi:hypothetical protein